MDILIKILSYVGAFLGGIAITFGQGWVTDHFKQKEATRNKIEEIMHKITDTLSIAKAS